MSPTVEFPVSFRKTWKGRKRIREGKTKAYTPAPKGRVPRVSRLVALAHHFDGLIRREDVKDLAEIARLGQVTRARITQIADLNYLAPDIAEDVLHLPPVTKGKDPITERHLRSVVQHKRWDEQRRVWNELKEKVE